MAKYSMKQGGKEVGPASVYAEPHTMSGKKLTMKDVNKAQRPGNELSASEMNASTLAAKVSMGSNKEVKTDGIKMRGTGAATKGVMSRGPMA
jgi:hypothetical protein